MELDDLSRSVVNGSFLHEAELCPLFCPLYKINVCSELPLGDPPFHFFLGVLPRKKPKTQSLRFEEDCLGCSQVSGEMMVLMFLCSADREHRLAFQF